MRAPFRPVVFVVALPCLVAGSGMCSGCGGLYGDPVTLPTAGTRDRAAVPLDIAWETPLIVYSGGSPAPMGIGNATATCLQPKQCVAHVVQPFVENDDPKVVVVGLVAGPADVELRYYHPVRKETMTAQLHFVFLPAEALRVVEVGDPLNGAPFVFKHVPDAYKNRTSSGAPAASSGEALEASARCEASHGSDALQYTCFPLEDVGGGERRYASCQHSTRCSVMPGGIVVDGFALCLEAGTDGRVTGALADTSLSSGPQVKSLGTWGVLTRACAREAGAP